MDDTTTHAKNHTHDGHTHDPLDGGHNHHHASEVRAQTVVLDLGDGIGALIVHTGPELLGVEIEISPADEDGNRQHKEVLQRVMGTEVANVLVYDNLPEGEYTLWRGETPTRRVRVESGSVAQLDWR